MFQYKSSELGEISLTALQEYINSLKVEHDRVLYEMQVQPSCFHEGSPLENELRQVEEEICWAEHELDVRKQKSEKSHFTPKGRCFQSQYRRA